MSQTVLVAIVAILGVLFLGNLMFGYQTFNNAVDSRSGSGTLGAYEPKPHSRHNLIVNLNTTDKDVGRFKDPKWALKLLTLLNPERPGDFNKQMNKPEFGLKRNPGYCKKSLEYLTTHQDEMFERINYIAEFDHESIPRSWVLRTLGGYDVMPEVSQSMPTKFRHSRKYDLRPNVNWFYFMKRLHVLQLIGKEIICDHQLYNHLVGAKELTHKDKVAGHFQKYQEQYVDRPQCIPPFMPSSYLLDDTQQCKNFFRHLETKEYATKVKKNNIVFIWKIGEGVHGGKGVLPFDRKLEADVKEKYDNGAKCGSLQEHVVMQQYINNPLLLHGRKFDFRMYMLVVSTNPLIAYYHDGYMRVSLANYDKNSEDLFAHLTNAHVSEQAMEEAKKEGTWRGKTYEELTAMQYGDFDTLGQFLVESGKIPSMDWIETDLRLKLRKAMIHLVRSTQWAFVNRSNTYEIFGVDLLVDDNLDVWFMECNANPAMKRAHPPYPPKEAFIADMLNDHFQLMFGYWRSRMKRQVELINRLTDKVKKNSDPDNFHPTDKWLAENRALFNDINQNRLEPEFEPSPKNRFFKIIDDNLDGTERYSELLSEECL